MKIKKTALALALLTVFSKQAFAAPMVVKTFDASSENTAAFELPSITPVSNSSYAEWAIGTAQTRYETYSAMNNRNTNMMLAVNAINGTVLFPYEVFSYNKTVGPRTAARGFKEATIFVGNQKDMGLGGGICQISSTLYMAAKKAGLTVTERHQHSLPVTYCAPEDEATVSWGYLDLKLKNNFDTPVKIKASMSRGVVNIEIVKLIK